MNTVKYKVLIEKTPGPLGRHVPCLVAYETIDGRFLEGPFWRTPRRLEKPIEELGLDDLPEAPKDRRASQSSFGWSKVRVWDSKGGFDCPSALELLSEEFERIKKESTTALAREPAKKTALEGELPVRSMDDEDGDSAKFLADNYPPERERGTGKD